MVKTGALIILLVLVLGGCDLVADNSSAGLEQIDPHEIVLADPADFAPEDWPSGTYTVTKAEIEGDVLHLRVTYGGCGDHDFELVAWNYFMESHPVQVHALLAHEREACEALFEKDLEFDLTPLKRAYQDSYGMSGTIILSVRDPGETFFPTVHYEFKM